MATLTTVTADGTGTLTIVSGSISQYDRAGGAWSETTSGISAATALGILDNAFRTSAANGDQAIGLTPGANGTVVIQVPLTSFNADFGSILTLVQGFSIVDYGPYSDDGDGFFGTSLRATVQTAGGTIIGGGPILDPITLTRHTSNGNWTPTPAYDLTDTFDYVDTAASKADWDGSYLELEFNDLRNMGGDVAAIILVDGIKLDGTYEPFEEKTDFPSRYNSSTAKTITAALAQDQWGKYVVPQVPWVNPVKRSSPASTGNGSECDFSPDGRFLAVSHATSPYITVFDRSGSTFTALSALTAPEGTSTGCSFSPDGRFLAVSHATSPFITVYEHDGDATFTKVTALTALENTSNDCAWSPDGRFLAVAHITSPYITVYERSGTSGTTFTKVTALTAPEGNGQGVAFSPDGRFLAVSLSTSPYITVYQRSDTTFTKVTALTALDGVGYKPSFSPGGCFLAVAHLTSPFITVYERDGTTFTKVSALTALAGGAHGCAWSPDGKHLAVAHDTTPYITVYQRSGDTFTKLANPTSLSSAGGRGCDWSPDGRFLAVAHATTSGILYETSGLNPREGYLWMQDPGER